MTGTMSNLDLTLPDGKNLSVAPGTPLCEVVREIGVGLLRNAVAVKVDGVNYSLDDLAQESGTLEVITRNSPSGLSTLRHSTAHLLAWAVQELHPETKFAFGPDISNGFYYDFDREESFSDDDLIAIEDKMRELAKRGDNITHHILPRVEAEKLFAEQPYKLEQIEALATNLLSIYHMGDFTDLCEGPHLPSTKDLKAFKLLSVAGAYWKDDASRPMLQRIYGTAFYKQKELKEHLLFLEEAKKRDHRKLGRELDLFGIMSEAGPGLSYWFPRGDILREEVINYWKQLHRDRDYVTVTTPHISQAELWETSGHMEYYRDNMYIFEQDGRPYVVKPMNCPGHILMYKRKIRSYRHLPIRYAELGTVYRAELKGTLHGLMRVRGFTQDDAHIFCTPDQLEAEVIGVLDLTRELLETFGFHEFKVELSVRDPLDKGKYAGSDAEWDAAEKSLIRALEQHELPYTRVEGEAVFYGPKIDIKLIDAIGRHWQATTVQFDFNLP
ncbi:MAG: threonine--tRNA ligase, partial [bacterium]